MQTLVKIIYKICDWLRRCKILPVVAALAVFMLTACAVDNAQIDAQRERIDSVCSNARTDILRNFCRTLGWSRPTPLLPEVTE